MLSRIRKEKLNGLSIQWDQETGAQDQNRTGDLMLTIRSGGIENIGLMNCKITT